MAKRVLKYPLADGDRETWMTLPVGAVALHVADQRGTAMLWTLADDSPAVAKQNRCFVTAHTGDIIPPGWRYIGTFIQDDGDYVGHVFEPAP